MVSSPLQFMFCCLIVQKWFRNRIVYAYYYKFNKDFTPLYEKISALLQVNNVKPMPLENFPTDISEKDKIFFGNRYNQNEILKYYENVSKTDKLYLYEEGFNTYLEHHFNNPKISDKNKILWLKNKIKLYILGAIPTHVYLGQFKKVFSTFKVGNLNNPEAWQQIDFIEQETDLEGRDGTCIFLLQSLCEDGLMSEKSFLTLVNSIIVQLTAIYDYIYIKPHPRNKSDIINRISSTSEKIMDIPELYADLPVELFLSKNRMDVIGFSSSTLMYSSSLFGFTTYHCMEEAIRYDNNNKILVLKDSVDQLFKIHNVKPLSNLK